MISSRARRPFLALALALIPGHIGGVVASAQPSGQPTQASGGGAGDTGPQEVITGTNRLLQLADLLYQRGMYDDAIPLVEKALAAREKALGAGHKDVGAVLMNLSRLYAAQGKYQLALPLLERALTIAVNSFGPDDPIVARVLNTIGGMYYETGDFVRAEECFQKALTIREKVLTPEHPDRGSSLNNLGEVYKEKGDLARAEPLLRRALALREKALGPDDPRVATILTNIGLLCRETGRLAEAERLYRRALAIREKQAGGEHPDVAHVLNKLARLYQAKGEGARAEPLFERALAVREKALGPDHPDVAASLNNLATLYYERRDYARAEPMLARAVAINEKALGANHPSVAAALGNLSVLYQAKGDIARAVEFMSRVGDIREHNLAQILATGSEKQKLLYMETLGGETDSTIALHALSAPKSTQAARLALLTILRRKGRAFDTLTDQIGDLRRRLDASDRQLLDQLSAARTQLAGLELRGPQRFGPGQYAAEVGRLNAEVERLEAAVSRRSAEFRARTQPVTLERVKQAIPEGAALVEIVTYYSTANAREGDKFSALHFVAYVLRREGDPAFVELGSATPILDAFLELRRALTDPAGWDAKRAGRALDELVARPVRKLLGDARLLLLSPDSMLNLVPFGALVDEGDRYLIERYTITYLTSGRDLLRAEAKASRQGPVIIADPAFDLGAQAGGQPAAGSKGADAAARTVIDLGNLAVGPLPGTAEEAKALQKILAGARVYTAAQATESNLKRVAGPNILHVATHGFFLAGPSRRAGDGGQTTTRDLALQRLPEGNPLLRSGLLFAGVKNGRSGEGEDGVLTALEASGLDLWGTQLVVLSACETGVGDLSSDGVYGLRRALLLAGAESELISLWKVSDEGTRELMEKYYLQLRAGAGRAEALRRVQLEMLRSPKRSTPFFWAAFIPAGDWKGLDLSAAPAK